MAPPPKLKPLFPASSDFSTCAPITCSTSSKGVFIPPFSQLSLLFDTSLSNYEIMSVLVFLCVHFLASNKELLNVKVSQFKDFKSSQKMVKLKTENTKLRNDIEDLINRISTLKLKESSDQLA